MTDTNNLGITLLEQSQSQKEVTINEAIFALEALQNRSVEDKDLSFPPISPNSGDAYIVGSSAGGEWLGRENNIAYFNQSWKFVAPNEGLFIWVNDEDSLYYFDGTSWQRYIESFQNLPTLGINATADNFNRLSVSSEAVLFNNNGAGVRVNLNKNSASDNASFIFQSGFSGRAEFGLAGNDDFSLRVSDDGSTFNDSFVVASESGNVSFKQKLSIGVNGADIAGVLSASEALNFGSVASSSSQSLNVNLVGAEVGNSVVVNTDLSAADGLFFEGYVSANDVVTIRATNITAAAINPASLNFRITIIRF